MTPYHVCLGGQGFLVDPTSYVVRGLAQVDPSLLALGGPAPDPFVERSQRQASFGAGEGVERFTDPSRPDGWRSGVGVVATASGGLGLGPLLADAGAGPVFSRGVRALAVYRGCLYAGVDGPPGAVWRFDGSTWTHLFDAGGDGVGALAVYRDRLYLARVGDGSVQRWDGAVLDEAWNNPSVSAIRTMAVAWIAGSPWLFLGNDVDGGSAWVQAFDGVVQGTMAFLEEPRVAVLAALGSRLVVGTASPGGQPAGALYTGDGSPGGLNRECVFGDGAPTSAAVVDERLALGWTHGRVRLWEPSGGFAELNLPTGGGLAPPLASAAGCLWAAGRDPATGGLGVRRHDVATGAWSLAAAGAAGDAPLALGSYGGSLYLGAGSASGGARVYRADLAEQALQGVAETPPFDAGWPDLDRALRSAGLRHAPLPAGARIDVQARLADGAPWVLLGSAEVAGAEVTTLPFPAGSVGRAPSFRLTLVRGPGAADGPELRELVVRFALSPPIRRAWTFSVLLEGDAARPVWRLDDTSEPLSAADLSAALWALRATPGPLPFVDLHGAAHNVWFRDLEEVPQRAAAPWTYGKVTLVEA